MHRNRRRKRTANKNRNKRVKRKSRSRNRLNINDILNLTIFYFSMISNPELIILSRINNEILLITKCERMMIIFLLFIVRFMFIIVLFLQFDQPYFTFMLFISYMHSLQLHDLLQFLQLLVTSVMHFLCSLLPFLTTQLFLIFVMHSQRRLFPQRRRTILLICVVCLMWQAAL